MVGLRLQPFPLSTAPSVIVRSVCSFIQLIRSVNSFVFYSGSFLCSVCLQFIYAVQFSSNGQFVISWFGSSVRSVRSTVCSSSVCG